MNLSERLSRLVETVVVRDSPYRVDCGRCINGCAEADEGDWVKRILGDRAPYSWVGWARPAALARAAGSPRGEARFVLSLGSWGAEVPRSHACDCDPSWIPAVLLAHSCGLLPARDEHVAQRLLLLGATPPVRVILARRRGESVPPHIVHMVLKDLLDDQGGLPPERHEEALLLLDRAAGLSPGGVVS